MRYAAPSSPKAVARTPEKQRQLFPLIRRSSVFAASHGMRPGARSSAAWFETALKRLLTMRMTYPWALTGRAQNITRGIVLAGLAFSAAGCASLENRNILPERLVSEAEIAGMPGVRMWGDASADEINATIRKYETDPASSSLKRERFDRDWPSNILALSGGGDNGAFGAGLLVGWSAGAGRPQFDLVTGISAGALIAPFAFLGPSRDGDLKAVFTEYGKSNILTMRPVSGLLIGSSLADSAPLAKLIAHYVDRPLLDQIARERQRGRVLLIGTTNIDSQRPVLWDMGRIAMSDQPQALSLFRKILLASASLPGLFPPVRLQVQAEGGAYDELHVDGGVTQQVFVAPPRLRFASAGATPARAPVRHLYIIRNGKISPEWQAVDERTFDIAARSISTLTKNQGIGDLYRIYTSAKRDGLDFNLASIPSTFDAPSNGLFDLSYMTSLFDTGYRLGRGGYSWLKAPPGLDSTEVKLPSLAQTELLR